MTGPGEGGVGQVQTHSNWRVRKLNDGIIIDVIL